MNCWKSPGAPVPAPALDQVKSAPVDLVTKLFYGFGSVAYGIDSPYAILGTVFDTLTNSGTITVTGTVIGDKHWIQVNAPKDQALMSRIAGRAFQVAGYRYEGLFRPLEQLLVPKPSPPDKSAKQSTPNPSKAAKQSPRAP